MSNILFQLSFGGGSSPVTFDGGITTSITSGTVVPVPAAVWLFGSGLIRLMGVARRKKLAM